MPTWLSIASVAFDSPHITRLAGNPGPAERSGSIGRGCILWGFHEEIFSLGAEKYPAMLETVSQRGCRS